MIAVTGSTGFIGAHLKQELGDSAIAIDLRSAGSSRVVEKQLRANDCTGLVHLASPLSNPNIEHADAVESEIFNLAEMCVQAAARVNGCHLVLLSSIRVHQNGGRVFSQETMVAPIDGYGRGKARAEELCISTSDSSHPVTVLRPSSVQGITIGGELRGLAGAFAMQAVKHGEIRVMGDGASMKDLLHVSDMVAAIIAALDADDSDEEFVRILPIGSGRGVSVLDLANMVAERTGAAVRHVPANPYDLSGVVDPGPARSALGWSARLTVEDIISEAIEAAIAEG